MKKIKYAFWDNEAETMVHDEFFAVGFTCGMAGVSFALSYFMENIFWSWDDLKRLVGTDVIFTVAAD